MLMPSTGSGRELALHAVEVRSGEQPLLLLHGLGRDHSTFLRLAGRLSPFWNPWLLDLRGHGKSPWRDDGAEYLVIDYVRDVVEWLRGRWSGGAVLYGHSLGAMIAAAVAAEKPDKTAAVVLEDPPFHTMGERMRGTFWEHLFRGLSETAREKSCQESLFKRLSEIPVPLNGNGQFGPLKLVRDNASLEYSAECLFKVDPEVFTPVKAGMWLNGYDVDAICRAIRCPVFLLQGNTDCGGALTDEDAQLFQRSAPRCELRRFADKGHQIHWPEPGEILPIFEDLERTLKPRNRSQL